MPSRDIRACTPTLQYFFPALKAWYFKKFPDRTLSLSCTSRSLEEQKAEFKAGRSKCDGVIKMSNHQYSPSKAFDVFVVIAGKAVWEEIYYVPMALAIKELGYEGKVKWGGDFRSFKGDVYHFEEA